MSGKHPSTIFTDQDVAMAAAIAFVFPNTSHRLCLWHIYLNAAKHLCHVIHASENKSEDKSENKSDDNSETSSYQISKDVSMKTDQRLTSYRNGMNCWHTALSITHGWQTYML